MTARVLLTDIECSPIVSAHWGLFNQNISIDQIREHPRVIGFGAKWYGGKPSRFWSEYHHSRLEMLTVIRDLLDEADAVVTYNGANFDQPWLHGELAREGLEVPSPYKTIDLYKIAKKSFRFPSHKLQYVSTALGQHGKLSTGGFRLWLDCLWGDDDAKRRAWNKMRRYCNQDVNELEPLFDTLRPYFPATINLAALSGNFERVCPVCESTNVQQRGFAVTASRRYKRYQCQDCGKWSKESKMEPGQVASLIGEAR